MQNYSNRPLWQMAILYLVVGAVIYVGIYYFFFARHTDYAVLPVAPSPIPTPTVKVTPSPTPKLKLKPTPQSK